MLKPWYDVKSVLAKKLGKTLIHWSKNAHSYHPDYTYEEWTSTLYMHGCALRRYGNQKFLDKVWEKHNFYNGFGYIEEDVAAQEAKVALQWVADNFHDMWD